MSKAIIFNGVRSILCLDFGLDLGNVAHYAFCGVVYLLALVYAFNRYFARYSLPKNLLIGRVSIWLGPYLSFAFDSKPLTTNNNDSDDDDGPEPMDPYVFAINSIKCLAALTILLTCIGSESSEFTAATLYQTLTWSIVSLALIESTWLSHFVPVPQSFYKKSADGSLLAFSIAVFTEAEYSLYLSHESNKQSPNFESMYRAWRHLLLSLVFMLACGFTPVGTPGTTLKSFHTAASPFSKLIGGWIYTAARLTKNKQITPDDLPDAVPYNNIKDSWIKGCHALKNLSSTWSLNYSILWLFRWDLLRYSLIDMILASLEPVRLYFNKAILDHLDPTDPNTDLLANILWIANCQFITDIALKVFDSINRTTKTRICTDIDNIIKAQSAYAVADSPDYQVMIKKRQRSALTGKSNIVFHYQYHDDMDPDSVYSSYFRLQTNIRTTIQTIGKLYLLYSIIGNYIIVPICLFATQPIFNTIPDLMINNKRERIRRQLETQLDWIQDNMVYEITTIKLLGWGSRMVEKWKTVRSIFIKYESSRSGAIFKQVTPSIFKLTILSIIFGTLPTSLSTADAFTTLNLIGVTKKPTYLLMRFLANKSVDIGEDNDDDDDFVIDDDDNNDQGPDDGLLGLLLTQQLQKQFQLKHVETSTKNTMKYGISHDAQFSWYLKTPELKLWPRDGTTGSFDCGPRGVEFMQRLYKYSCREGYQLKDINVEFSPNQLTVISGPTGCGKTSLLLALMGEMCCIKGQVHFPFIKKVQDGIEFIELDGVSYVEQSPDVLNKTIRDNILFGESMDAERYKMVLEATALIPDILKFKSRDLTIVGEKGTKLSGGQKQRVALARAMYKKSTVLVIDDCLSAVDAITANHLVKYCLTPNTPLTKGRTCILATSNLAICAPLAAKVVLIEKGKIVKQGTPQELNYAESKLDTDNDKKSISDSLEIKNLSVGMIDWDVTGSQGLAEEDEMEYDHDPDDFETNESVSYLHSLTQNFKAAIQSMLEMYKFVAICGGIWFILQNVFVSSFESSISTFNVYWLGKFSQKTSELKKMGPKMFIIGQTLSNIASVLSENFSSYLNTIATTEKSGLLQEKMVSRLINAVPAFFHTQRRIDIHNQLFSNSSEFITRFIGTVSRLSQNMFNVAYIAILLIQETPNSLVFLVFSAVLFSYKSYMSQYCYALVHSLYKSRKLMYRESNLSTDPVINRTFGLKARSYKDQIELSNRALRINQFREGDAMRSSIIYSLAKLITKSFITLTLGLQATPVSQELSSGAAKLTKLASSSSSKSRNSGFIHNQAMEFPDKVTGTFWSLSKIKEHGFKLKYTTKYLLVEQEAPPLTDSNFQLRPSWPESGSIKVRNLCSAYDKYAAMAMKSNQNEPANENSKSTNKNSNDSAAPLVIRNMSFDIKGGEKVGVLGRSGAGKTTLALTLMRFLEPKAESSITIDGVDITKIGLEDLRRRVTIIPQVARMLDGTIRDNVDPFDEFTDDEVWDILIKVGLFKSRNEKTKEDYDEEVDSSDSEIDDDEDDGISGSSWSIQKYLSLNYIKLLFRVAYLGRGSKNTKRKRRQNWTNRKPRQTLKFLDDKANGWPIKLSQGQKQLITLARAILRKSKVVIMDEPTASLDKKTDSRLQNLVRSDLMADTTILCIAHRLQTIIDYDRVLVIDDGQLIENGIPYELLCDENSRLYQTCLVSGELISLKAKAKAKYDAMK